MEQATLIDLIYEAAVIPENWVSILDQMAQISGGEGALLFAASQPGVQMLRSPAIAEVLDVWISSGWAARNERAQRLAAIREPRFLTDLDGFSTEELDRTPYYRDFLRPLGFGWCTGTTINSPSGETIIFSVERLYKRGPVEGEALRTLDFLRPHLARAALLAAQVGLERARAQVVALDALGFPAAVLNSTGRVLAANNSIVECRPALAIGAGDSLQFQDRDTHRVFSSVVHGSSRTSALPHARSFPIKGDDARAPAVAHLVPLRRNARDLFDGAHFILYVTTLSSTATVPRVILQALFDLTPAEARVAELVGSGRTLAEVSTETRAALGTIRHQLKSVFEKIGVRRQAELVKLLTLPAIERHVLKP